MHFRACLHDVSCYSHFNAHKHETSQAKYWEDIHYVVPNQIIGVHVPPFPGFGVYETDPSARYIQPEQTHKYTHITHIHPRLSVSIPV